MYQPQTYAIALVFMLVSMFCWGSWANTLKMCSGYRFQLFYWDYVGGLILGALAWGLTFGSLGSTGLPFLRDLAQSDLRHILLAVFGGVIFNAANLLLVAAIDIAGLAVAFPIGIGLALVIGAVSSYILTPAGNPLLLFGGIALVTAAIVLDAIAYRLREASRPAMSKRGIVISLVAGVLMGCFYPFVSRSMSGEHAPGPYAAVLFFALGVALCSVPLNYALMRMPLDKSAPIAMPGYWKAKAGWHLWGLIGGAIWCTGALANFVASRANIVGPAVSYSIGQGATMVSACWGVFIWKEFAQAPPRSRLSLVWMFIFFVSGLTAIAVAPLFS
ncbi:MAG TPA: GRP family sugar transporter [Terracidiphilus sp.]|nr:GRP family sugar transporter [Terracidiphilus sp.]